jgi:hypothetical protein
VAERDRGNHLADETDQLARFKLKLHVPVLLDDALEPRVLAFHGFEGVVDQAGDRAEGIGFGLAVADADLGVGRQRGVFFGGLPACQGGNPEDVILGDVVAILQLGLDGRLVGLVALVVSPVEVVLALAIAEHGAQLFAPQVERVGHVLQEDEPEHRVLVDGCIEGGAEPVG